MPAASNPETIGVIESVVDNAFESPCAIEDCFDGMSMKCIYLPCPCYKSSSLEMFCKIVGFSVGKQGKASF